MDILQRTLNYLSLTHENNTIVMDQNTKQKKDEDKCVVEQILDLRTNVQMDSDDKKSWFHKFKETEKHFETILSDPTKKKDTLKQWIELQEKVQTFTHYEWVVQWTAINSLLWFVDQPCVMIPEWSKFVNIRVEEIQIWDALGQNYPKYIVQPSLDFYLISLLNEKTKFNPNYLKIIQMQRYRTIIAVVFANFFFSLTNEEMKINTLIRNDQEMYIKQMEILLPKFKLHFDSSAKDIQNVFQSKWDQLIHLCSQNKTEYLDNLVLFMHKQIFLSCEAFAFAHNLCSLVPFVQEPLCIQIQQLCKPIVENCELSIVAFKVFKDSSSKLVKLLYSYDSKL